MLFMVVVVFLFVSVSPPKKRRFGAVEFGYLENSSCDVHFHQQIYQPPKPAIQLPQKIGISLCFPGSLVSRFCMFCMF